MHKNAFLLGLSSLFLCILLPSAGRSQSLKDQFNNQSSCNPSLAQYRYNNQSGSGGGAFMGLAAGMDAQSIMAHGAPVQVTPNGDIFLAYSSSNCQKLGSLTQSTYKPVPNPQEFNCSIIKTEWSLSDDKSALYEFLQVGQVAYIAGTASRTFSPCSNPFLGGVIRKVHAKIDQPMRSSAEQRATELSRELGQYPVILMSCPSKYEEDKGKERYVNFAMFNKTPSETGVFINTPRMVRGGKPYFSPYVVSKNIWEYTEESGQPGYRIRKNSSGLAAIPMAYRYETVYLGRNSGEVQFSYENVIDFEASYYTELGVSKEKILCDKPFEVREGLASMDFDVVPAKVASPTSSSTQYNFHKGGRKKIYGF